VTRLAREISHEELIDIASRVRARLEKKFGKEKVKVWQMNSPDVAEQFIKETYIAVRDHLEKEAT
jgi:hypothetical protein